MYLFTIISFIFIVGALCDSYTSAPNKRIENGIRAAVGKYPYMVSLRSANIHFCGGSIINNNWVLTSATCVKDLTSFQIVVGTNKLNLGGDIYYSSTIKIHPSYNPDTQIYDVAIVKTATPIVYSANVQPVVLTSVLPIASTVVVQTGWGQLNMASGIPSNNLLVFNTTVISKTNCQPKIPTFPLQHTHFCTFQTTAGACTFDDGGPLSLGSTQIGIILLYGCELSYPDVYTSIPSVYIWIMTNVF